MPLINTTHGPTDESDLQRTVGFEDRQNEFVVWVEWRLSNHPRVCAFCETPGNPQPDGSGVVLVRRDAHVILKQPSATADALVGGIG